MEQGDDSDTLAARVADLERRLESARATESALNDGPPYPERDDDDREHDDDPGDPADMATAEVHSLERNLFTAKQQLADARFRDLTLGRAALHALEDQPADIRPEDDLLGSHAYVEALASLVNAPRTSLPLTVAVSGPWGSGKSTIVAGLKRRLKGTPVPNGEFAHVVVDFNAWMHADAQHVESALMSAVSRELVKFRTPWFGLPGRLLTRRERWSRLAIYAALLAGLGILLWGMQLGTSVIAWTAGAGGIVALLAFIPQAGSGLRAVAAFAGNPAKEAATGTLARTAESWARFVRRQLPPGTRLVVIVEDLDRCEPSHALEVVSCCNQLLSNRDTIIFLVGDMDVLARVVGRAWLAGFRPNGTDDEALLAGLDFLQKIVQVRAEIPLQSGATLLELLKKSAKPAPSVKGNLVRSRVKNFLAPWQRAAWAPNRRPRNPYFAYWPSPRAILNSWVYEFVVLGRATIMMARQAVLPKNLRKEIRPSLALRHYVLRLLANLTVNLGLAAIFLAASASTTNGWSRTAFFMAASVFGNWAVIFLVYMAPISIIIGVAMGLDIRRQARKAPDLAPGEFVEQQRRDLKVRELPAYEDVDDSEPLQLALGAALSYGDATPRLAKRVANRLRLEIHLGRSTGLTARMTQFGQISAAAIGKWVVLTEKWPAVYGEIIRNPAILEQWENGKMTERLEAIVPGGQLEAVVEFLATAPKLGPRVSALLTRRPSENRFSFRAASPPPKPPS